MFKLPGGLSKLLGKSNLPSETVRQNSISNSQAVSQEIAAQRAAEFVAAGKRAFEEERFDEAVKNYDKARDFAEHGLSPEGQAELWFDSGLAYQRVGNPIKAYACYDFAIQTYEENNIKADYSYCLGNSALLGVAVDFQKSAERLERASAMGREFGDRQSAVYHLGRLGNVYEENSEPKKAIDCYERAAKLSAEYGDKSGEMMSLGSLGGMYSQVNDGPKALSYIARALALSRELGNQSIEVDCLRKLGLGYLQSGDYSKAAEYYDQVLGIARQSGHGGLEVESLVNLGGAYAGLEQSKKAIDAYDAALKIMPANQKRDSDAIRGAIAALRTKYPNLT